MTSSLDVDQPVERGADVIDLRVPADPAYLAVVRTATAGVASRLDLTLDEIEDLRIAVDEACALLMPKERPTPASLHAVFSVEPGRLRVHITGPRGDDALDAGYPWMLLRALVSEVTTGHDASGRWITLAYRTGA